MRIGILQPGYLPWLGFFEQIYKSDVFIIYDDVQYDKNGWRNRNRIKTPNGAQWLTVPVHFKLKENLPVNEVKIDNSLNWRKKHLFSIKNNYSKAPFYENYIKIFEDAYAIDWVGLVDLDMYFIHKLLECIGMRDKKIIMSSSLAVKSSGVGKLIEICKIFKADIFYEGAAGRDYIDENIFLNEGIKIEYQDYKHPEYSQLYGKFIPYLSVIDLLFNHGENSLSILANANSEGVEN